MDPLIGLAVAAVLIAVNALFVSVEFSIIYARPLHLDKMGANHRLDVEMTRDDARYLDVSLSICQTLIVLSALAIGWIGGLALSESFKDLEITLGVSPSIAYVIAIPAGFVAIFVLYLMLGRKMPRLLVAAAPGRTLHVTTPLLRTIHWVFAPIITGIDRATKKIIRAITGSALNFVPSGYDTAHSEDELQVLLRASAAEGNLDHIEHKMASRSLELGDVSLRDIMTSRHEIIALPRSDTFIEARERILRNGHTRMLVVGDGFDEVIGVISWLDLFGVSDPDWVSRVTPALFLPGSLTVSSALAKMCDDHEEFAVVLDEFGAVDGLVTIRTLLDDLIAKSVEIALPAVLPARMALRQLARSIGIEPPEHLEAVTLGGMLTELLGHMPAHGEIYVLGDHVISAAAVEPRGVIMVRVEHATPNAGRACSRTIV